MKVTFNEATNELTMTVKLATSPTLSSSGKSKNLYTSGGNKALEGVTINGQPVIAGINIYQPVK